MLLLSGCNWACFGDLYQNGPETHNSNAGFSNAYLARIVVFGSPAESLRNLLKRKLY